MKAESGAGEKITLTGVPETMAVREKPLPESGPVSQIAASAMDERWAEQVEAAGKPALAVIEGLTMYRRNRM